MSNELKDTLVTFAGGMICYFISLYIHIIIHEGGHLIFGLLTGYRFLSFRIGSFVIQKNNKGFNFKTMSLSGTGGQCLLWPPKKDENGKYPYRLYHLGGILMNLIFSLLAIYLWIKLGRRDHMFFLFFAAAGIALFFSNGMPVKVGGIGTDGFNVFNMAKEEFGLEAMWRQLQINGELAEGRRLKDMPEEWFEIPENANRKNELISSIEVFRENRMMDLHEFDKAEELLNRMLDGDEYSIIGLYRNYLINDRLALNVLKNGKDADVSMLSDKEFRKFRKSMEDYPSIIRSDYAYKLIYKSDEEEAEKCLQHFEKIRKTYPYASDLIIEKEIIDIIRDKYEREKVSE